LYKLQNVNFRFATDNDGMKMLLLRSFNCCSRWICLSDCMHL